MDCMPHGNSPTPAMVCTMCPSSDGEPLTATVRRPSPPGSLSRSQPSNARVRNIYVNNSVFDEVEDLFYVTSMYAGEGLDNHHFSEIENLQVDGLKCRKVRQAALVVQGTRQKPVRGVVLKNIEVGECKNGISFEYAEPVQMSNCFIGGKVGIPTQVTAKDKLFENEKMRK